MPWEQSGWTPCVWNFRNDCAGAEPYLVSLVQDLSKEDTNGNMFAEAFRTCDVCKMIPQLSQHILLGPMKVESVPYQHLWTINSTQREIRNKYPLYKVYMGLSIKGPLSQGALTIVQALWRGFPVMGGVILRSVIPPDLRVVFLWLVRYSRI